VNDEDRIKLPADDFRRVRRALLSPDLFGDPDTGDELPPTDLASQEALTGGAMLLLPVDGHWRVLKAPQLPIHDVSVDAFDCP